MRTIAGSVEKRGTTIDAVVSLGMAGEDKQGAGGGGAGRRELTIGKGPLKRLETIIDPLIVPDLVTIVWSPHDHDDAIDALIRLAGVVLIDTVAAPDPAAAVKRAQWLTERAYVVDLAWLRSLPWRERMPPPLAPPPGAPPPCAAT